MAGVRKSAAELDIEATQLLALPTKIDGVEEPPRRGQPLIVLGEELESSKFFRHINTSPADWTI